MVQNRPWPEVSLKQSGGMRPMGAHLHEGPRPSRSACALQTSLAWTLQKTALWGWRTQVRGKSHQLRGSPNALNVESGSGKEGRAGAPWKHVFMGKREPGSARTGSPDLLVSASHAVPCLHGCCTGGFLKDPTDFTPLPGPGNKGSTAAPAQASRRAARLTRAPA